MGEYPCPGCRRPGIAELAADGGDVHPELVQTKPGPTPPARRADGRVPAGTISARAAAPPGCHPTRCLPTASLAGHEPAPAPCPMGFRHLQDLQAEEILDLQGGDDDGDTTGETPGSPRGEYSIGARAPCPWPPETARDEVAIKGRPRQLLGHRVEDHHEGGSGARKWRSRIPGHGDDDAGDDGGIKPVLGRHPTGDGQRHGKGMAMMPTVMPAMRSRPSARHAVGFVNGIGAMRWPASRLVRKLDCACLGNTRRGDKGRGEPAPDHHQGPAELSTRRWYRRQPYPTRPDNSMGRIKMAMSAQYCR